MISQGVIYSLLWASRQEGPVALNGPSFEDFAFGLSNALAQWLPGIPFSGVAPGVAGVGVIDSANSRILTSATLAGCYASFEGAGVKGLVAPSVAYCCLSMMQKLFLVTQYAGTVTSVGGIDTSIATSMSSEILQASLTDQWRGVAGPQVALAVSSCLGYILASTVATAPVLGIASIPPVSILGVSSSTLL